MLKFRPLLLLPALITSSYGLIFAVDSAQLVPEATYAKAHGEGFTKAIIRGYEEACGIGGEVDPNFVPSYKNARAAGYTDIDMYWFPCNGSGHNCKSYATQLSEIAATLRANSMNIGTIWIDLEKDSAVCNNVSIAERSEPPQICSLTKFVQWNYGSSGNAAQARSLIAAMKDTGFKYGIYSSPGVSYSIFILRQEGKLTNKNQEWGAIFGTTSFVLDNSAPLWFATYNNVEVSISLAHMFNSKTFSFLVVDSSTRNSFRRVSPFFVLVYNLSKLFLPDGLLLLATNTPTSLPQDYLTSVSLLLDSSIPFPLLNLRSSLVVCTSRKLILDLSGNFLQTVSKNGSVMKFIINFHSLSMTLSMHVRHQYS